MMKYTSYYRPTSRQSISKNPNPNATRSTEYGVCVAILVDPHVENIHLLTNRATHS